MSRFLLTQDPRHFPLRLIFDVRQKNTIMEPGTGLTILGTAIGSAKVLEKILGPTADYLGGGIRSWTEQSVKNIANIFRAAQARLGEGIENPGAVPPRVLKEVLSEGAFCDDPLAAEYFGGVLASSRSNVSRDDRGATWASLVARLSAYQIRSHFLFYRAIYDRFRGQDFHFSMDDRQNMQVLLPFSEYARAMDLSMEERTQFPSILNHAFFGLKKEDLIETFMYGNRDGLTKHRGSEYKWPEEGGILATPSALGCELFLWVHGHGSQPLSATLKLELEIPNGIGICSTVYAKDDLSNAKK
jgi:hypothetical protein